MKARIFTSIFLMISFVTFAQSSRRDGNDNRNHERINRNVENNSNRKNESRVHFDNSKNENRREFSRESNTRNENHRNDFAASVNRMPERRGWDNNRETFRQDRYREVRSDYRSQNSFRRPILDVHYRHHIEPLEVRRVRFPFRAPFRADIMWTNSMYSDYRTFYPEVSWRYPFGYRIISISAYDSRDYIGEVANIYGRVAETYYNIETDEYYLYIGETYPYQDFTVVIPGYEARRFSRNPDYYFANMNISVTGYVVNIEGKPEIQVRRASQINVY